MCDLLGLPRLETVPIAEEPFYTGLWFVDYGTVSEAVKELDRRAASV